MNGIYKLKSIKENPFVSERFLSKSVLSAALSGFSDWNRHLTTRTYLSILCNPDHHHAFQDTMLITISRLKQIFFRSLSFVYAYRRLLFIIFFILPFISYLFVWIFSTTETFFPRPLRQAKEVLIVVAHPDDECASLVS